MDRNICPVIFTRTPHASDSLTDTIDAIELIGSTASLGFVARSGSTPSADPLLGIGGRVVDALPAASTKDASRLEWVGLIRESINLRRIICDRMETTARTLLRSKGV